MARAQNSQSEDFAAGSAGDNASHWTKWSAATGGDLKWSAALSPDPAALTADQFYRIAVNGITLRVPIGSQGATESAARDALNGILNGGGWFQLHSGDPGANGTDNVLTPTRIQIPIARFTFSDG